jgi:hypothetical protein
MSAFSTNNDATGSALAATMAVCPRDRLDSIDKTRPYQEASDTYCPNRVSSTWSCSSSRAVLTNCKSASAMPMSCGTTPSLNVVSINASRRIQQVNRPPDTHASLPPRSQGFPRQVILCTQTVITYLQNRVFLSVLAPIHRLRLSMGCSSTLCITRGCL